MAAAPGAPSAGMPQIAPLAKYKLVFLGDQGAGKTSIITRCVPSSSPRVCLCVSGECSSSARRRFMYDSFDKNYQVLAQTRRAPASGT